MDKCTLWLDNNRLAVENFPNHEHKLAVNVDKQSKSVDIICGNKTGAGFVLFMSSIKKKCCNFYQR